MKTISPASSNILLYQIICASFCVIVVISQIIATKIVHIPFLADFGGIPAGLITYPLTFFLSDLVTELFGAKKARLMVYMALGTTLLSYSIIEIALMLPTHDTLMQNALELTLGLNGLIIFASLVAYIIAQLLDIQIYAYIKRKTCDRFLWLRNNGSTLISQLVDTIVVNLIYLYWGMGMALDVVIQIMIFSYFYKAFFSICNTPFFYLFVFLGKRKMRYVDAVFVGRQVRGNAERQGI